MATIEELKTQIETANALGRTNLAEKGFELPANATTYEIMQGIAEINSDVITDMQPPDFSGGTDAIETLIDESGVLDSTEGSVESKVEKLIDKAEWENFWYMQSGNWTNQFKALMNVSPYIKTLPRFKFENATDITWLTAQSSIETIDYYINSPKLTTAQAPFYKCSLLKFMVGLDCSKVTNLNSTFYGCGALETIQEPLNFSSAKTLPNTFWGCMALKNIRFVEGTIYASIDFAHSNLLSAESIQSIINGLATVTTAQTLTLNSAIVLTDEQKATINSKGWTLAQ